jgi:Repeat of unknown function (DUF5648)
MVRRAHHLYALLTLIALAATPAMVSARTLEVGPDGRTGFATIQAAVDAAVDGDVVVIRPGTYTGRGNRDINLQRKTIEIRSTDPADPGVVEATILDCQGTAADAHRALHISDFTGRISGLTITNGYAAAGGAIYCEKSNLLLAHCRILNNATLPGDSKTDPDGGPGGGLYCLGSAVEIDDCLIAGNATGAGLDSAGTAAGAGGDGGGLYADDSVVYFTDSTIADNVAGDGGDSNMLAGRGGDGGGLWCDSVVLTRTSVLRNASGRGGSGPAGQRGGNGAGVHCNRATIDRCIIEANTAGAGGDSADAGREIGGDGGDGAGLFCADAIEMLDTLLAGNRTGQGGNALNAATAGDDGQGAGLWCTLGLIDHCTIVSNAIAAQKSSGATGGKFVASPGAGIFCTTDTVITNAILWANVPDQLAGQDCDNVVYCNIKASACLTSPGNLSADPRFIRPGNWVDPRNPSLVVLSSTPGAVWASGDYRLSDASPCADAGDPDGPRDPNRTDLQGAPRFSGPAPDMGAYEREALTPLYRFVAPATGKYFYTPSEAEKDKLVTRFAHLWTFEGIAYHVYLRPNDAGLMPVYRFWSPALASHLWTMDEAERDKLIANFPHLWTYEGTAFYAYPAGKQPPEARPVHRFWSDRLSGHFFTIDEDERQHVVDTLARTWTYEQVAWYAFDLDGAGQTPGTPAAAVYEFTGGRDSASYNLELKAYLDGQEAQLDTTNVAFTPAAGRMQMAVDLGALTTELNEFHIETELLQHDRIATEPASKLALPFSMYLYAFFDTAVARGPYAIDARNLTFPATGRQGSVAEGETFTVAGSVIVEGTKFDVDLTLSPTEFALDGLATFDNSDDSGRLDVIMEGPFQWTRSRQEDLLLEADVRGHRLQLYVTTAQVRSTGLWMGKRVPQAKDEGK